MLLLFCLGIYTLIATASIHETRYGLGSRTLGNSDWWNLLSMVASIPTFFILFALAIGEPVYLLTEVNRTPATRCQLNLLWSCLIFTWCGGLALEYLPGMGRYRAQTDMATDGVEVRTSVGGCRRS